jgi:hypothetical protein
VSCGVVVDVTDRGSVTAKCGRTCSTNSLPLLCSSRTQIKFLPRRSTCRSMRCEFLLCLAVRVPTSYLGEVLASGRARHQGRAVRALPQPRGDRVLGGWTVDAQNPTRDAVFFCSLDWLALSCDQLPALTLRRRAAAARWPWVHATAHSIHVARRERSQDRQARQPTITTLSFVQM